MAAEHLAQSAHSDKNSLFLKVTMAIGKLIRVTGIRPSTLVNLGQRKKGAYDV